MVKIQYFYALTLDSGRSRLGDFVGDHQEVQFLRKTPKNQETFFSQKCGKTMFLVEKETGRAFVGQKKKENICQTNGETFFVKIKNGENIFNQKIGTPFFDQKMERHL